MSQSCESCHHPSTTCLTGGMKCLVAAHYGQTSFVVFFKNKFAKLSHAVMFFIERRRFQLLKSFSNRTVMNFNIYHVHWGLSLTWSSFLSLWVLNSLTLGRDAGTLNAPDQQTAKSSAFIEVLTPEGAAGTPTYFNSWVHRTWRRSCAKKKKKSNNLSLFDQTTVVFCIVVTE